MVTAKDISNIIELIGSARDNYDPEFNDSFEEAILNIIKNNVSDSNKPEEERLWLN